MGEMYRSDQERRISQMEKQAEALRRNWTQLGIDKNDFLKRKSLQIEKDQSFLGQNNKSLVFYFHVHGCGGTSVCNWAKRAARTPRSRVRMTEEQQKGDCNIPKERLRGITCSEMLAN